MLSFNDFLVSLITTLVIFAILSFYFYFKKNKKKIEDLKKESKLSLEESLDLATSEQLISNLRKRVKNPYVLITPSKIPDAEGMIVEIHDVEPVFALSILKNAFVVTVRELKAKGYNVQPVFEEEDYDPEEEEF
ncbi:MAG: hypothetical protein EKK64_10750 [Neisseriaceae bacterium]|nr:MAG: hypothetical protein EKK64_10750 [Neisseriaceae bacterium]